MISPPAWAKERLAGVGSERVLEDILPAGVGGEVVAPPVGAVGRVVTLDDAVVLRDAGVVEAGANGQLFFQVLDHVDLQQPLQRAFGVGICSRS